MASGYTDPFCGFEGDHEQMMCLRNLHSYFFHLTKFEANMAQNCGVMNFYIINHTSDHWTTLSCSALIVSILQLTQKSLNALGKFSCLIPLMS